jgi:hypothetical protein
MIHQAQVPARIAEYFGCGTLPGAAEHPVIGQIFRPEVGWRRYTFRKRVSLSWLRKLRAQGVTSVAIDYHGRRADFTIDEVVRYANRPLLGGRLI